MLSLRIKLIVEYINTDKAKLSFNIKNTSGIKFNLKVQNGKNTLN